MPAIAEYETTATSVTVNPRMSPGVASGSTTRHTRAGTPAPMERAASIKPGWTSSSAASTSLAKNGTGAIGAGTVAAALPIVVPVVALVNGTTATMSSTNGALRPMLTASPSGWFTSVNGRGPDFEVT